MDTWMNHAWYRRETLKDLETMTYREIRVVGKWAIALFTAEERHAAELEAKNRG